MSFTRLPFPDLLQALGGKDPVPGGGSAAALAGALAASLARMVGALTIGKKNYETVSDEAESLADAAQALADRFLDLAEADAAAFDAVMQAMGLPKATDDEKAARKAAMQRAFAGATEPPLAVAAACLDADRLAARLLEIGNKNAASDAAVASLLAVAGCEGALLNVVINLGSIQDDAERTRIQAQADALWAAAADRRAALWPRAAAAGLDTPR